MFYGSKAFKFLVKGQARPSRELRKQAPDYRVKPYLARASRWIRMICRFNGPQVFRKLWMTFEWDHDRQGLIEALVDLKYTTGMQVGILSGLSKGEVEQVLNKGGMFVKCSHWSTEQKQFARAMLEVAAKARQAGWTPAELQEEFAVQFDLTFTDY